LLPLVEEGRQARLETNLLSLVEEGREAGLETNLLFAG
jgi:hypothetical protein